MNVEIELQKLIARVDNLQNAFVQSQRNQVPITAKVDTTSSKTPQIDENTDGVSENSDAVFDIASLADENSQAIMELAEMIAEMEA